MTGIKAIELRITDKERRKRIMKNSLLKKLEIGRFAATAAKGAEANAPKSIGMARVQRLVTICG
ncbi:hypothetical protein [Acetobacterium sp. K1/6]|uniref:hypothetical protein n=1 Tax=Acetobacterium sp. K1/6 TaxID=3055467 RepID=UPI002ACA941C|nr:hypothetical protein [Acetobacterium sp. K1/6]MDZ5724916.1 hypothetical protein [Acetobacterium sp. K1/6]